MSSYQFFRTAFLLVYLLVVILSVCEAERSVRPRRGSALPVDKKNADTQQTMESFSRERYRRLGSDGGKGGKGKGGKGYGYSNGKGGKGKGGKGGKGKGGKGSGSGSGWMDGEYYGCLALSEDEVYEIEMNGHQDVSCDYTVHAIEFSNGTSITSSEFMESNYTVAGTDESSYAVYQSSESNYEGSAYYGNGEVNGQGADQAENANTNEYSDNTNSNTGNENSNGNGNDGDNEGNGGQDDVQGNSGSTYEIETVEAIDYVETSAYGEIDPYEAFDINECDTFEHLWVWDVKMSCGNAADTSNCTCTYADELMDLGLLSCPDIVDCPRNCEICQNCLRFLGCEDPETVSTLAEDSTMMAATIFSLLSIGAFCLIYGKKREMKDTDNLDTHLMNDEEGASRGKRVWKLRQLGGAPRGDKSIAEQEQGPSVWLVPELDSVSDSVCDSESTSTAVQSEIEVPQERMVGLSGVIKTLVSRGPITKEYEFGGGKMVIKPKHSSPSNESGFPNILGLGNKKDQSMPPNRIMTNPTDVSSENSEGGESDTYGFTSAYEKSGLELPSCPAPSQKLMQQ